MTRSFLFLQGPHGPFFHRLGRALRQRGYEVVRVNFNGGDFVDWPWPNAFAFRDHPETWPSWVADLARQHEVTDLVLYGDCRPLHRAAITALEPNGMRIHVFEEGYLRPDWVTLERNGANGNSRMRLDADDLLARAETLRRPMPPQAPLRGTATARTSYCLRNYLGRSLDFCLFRNYQSQRPCSALREVVSWVQRWLRRALRGRSMHRRLNALLSSPAPFFLLTLQLDNDAAVRHHSRFSGMTEVIGEVVRSFARFAPSNTYLVVKNHPLDNGLIDFDRVTRKITAQTGVFDRVFFIDSGHLPTLLKRVAGVVTVNSTSGLQAIHHRRPTKVLGTSLYGLLGLVDSKPLDAFWRDPTAPNSALYAALRQRLLAECQFNGSFYTKEGIARLLPPIMQSMIGQVAVSPVTPADKQATLLLVTRWSCVANQEIV
jgi:capsular polysaccharide export protein